MRVSSLIVLAAKRRLEEEPGLLGVRVSPIAVEAQDLKALPKEVERLLGPAVHLVASAPGLPYRLEGRTCLAPDHRAAEQATAWRNTISVGRGEHLLYISVEEHDKASGLRDCLLQVTEADIKGVFIERCREPESGLPRGLAESLRETGLLDELPPAALCEYAGAVARDQGRLSEWAAAGQHLPLLGLMRDSRLTEKDAVERLAANERLVRQGSTVDRRRTTLPGPVSEVVSTLKEALGSSGEPQRSILAKVDLGTLRTGTIREARPRARRATPAAGKVKAAKATRSMRQEQPAPERGDRATQSGRVAVAPEKGSSAPGGPVVQLPTAPSLPAGLERLLTDQLSSGGSVREWQVTSDPRRALTTLPATARLYEGTPLMVPQELKGAYEAWQVQRQRLVALVSSGTPGADAVRLLAAPALLCTQPRLHEAAHGLLRAALELYTAAAGTTGDRTQRDILALETVCVRAEEGGILRVLGPLHPLWLAQALARAEEELSDSLGEAARRLLTRAGRVTPAAPQTWPEPVRPGATLPRPPELSLSRPEAGLLVYESTPTAVAAGALRVVGQQLLRRYLALCPHASFGVKVAVLGGEVAGLVEGLALHATEDGLLKLVEVYCSSAVSLGSAALQLQQEGRLRIRALPTEERRIWEEVRPHMVVRPVALEEPAGDEEPGTPSVATAAGGLLQTEFEIREHGLRTRTSVAADKVLSAVEAVHALARGRLPAKVFVAESAVRPLPALLRAEGAPASTWHVLVGHGLGRRPPVGAHLLVHERVDETTTCTVVTRDIRPASRALSEALRQVGVQEERPLALRGLASCLASSSTGGLVSLERSGEHLVAGAVVALELQRRAGPRATGLIAYLEGAYYSALVDESAAQDPMGALLLGCFLKQGRLHLQVGYATLDRSASVELDRGQLGGAVGRRLSHVLEALELSRGKGVGATAARELLSWLLWPALALQESRPPELQEALRAWRLAQAEPDVVCLLPPALAGPKGRSYRLGRTPVSVSALNEETVNRLILAKGV